MDFSERRAFSLSTALLNPLSFLSYAATVATKPFWAHCPKLLHYAPPGERAKWGRETRGGELQGSQVDGIDWVWAVIFNFNSGFYSHRLRYDV